VDFNGLIVLAAVWFLFNLINNARRKSRGPAETRQPEPMRPRPRPFRPDATQREGSRLELVLRELQRSLEDAAQSGRPTATMPPVEDVEESESLEMEPEVASLEGEVHREVRQRVDRDDEAGNVEAQRIQAAAARDTARTRTDHLAFDQRIRKEAADHTAAPMYTGRQLRDAVVWREILGPPVSERDER
jgi:hypothetical protein